MLGVVTWHEAVSYITYVKHTFKGSRVIGVSHRMLQQPFALMHTVLHATC
jgi:hypothetical protein